MKNSPADAVPGGPPAGRAMATAPNTDSGSVGSSPPATSTGDRYRGSNAPAGRISRGMEEPDATLAPASTAAGPTVRAAPSYARAATFAAKLPAVRGAE